MWLTCAQSFASPRPPTILMLQSSNRVCDLWFQIAMGYGSCSAATTKHGCGGALEPDDAPPTHTGQMHAFIHYWLYEKSGIGPTWWFVHPAQRYSSR